MPPARTRVIALTCGLALSVSLGACSSASTRPPAPAAPAAAQPDTRADAAPLLDAVLGRISREGGVHSTVEGSLGTLGELTSEGSVRYAEHTADLALHGGLRMPGTQRRHPVDMIIVDGVGYAKSPLVQSQPAWIRIAPGEHDFAAKLLSPAMEQVQDSTDPRSAFAGVEHATKIQSSGPDQLDGSPTTRYDLRVRTEQAARTAPDPDQREQLVQAARDGEPELGYRLWLDANGLPVRFAATRDIDQAGEVSLTSTYRDWGATVRIQEPPPEQTGALQGR